MTNQVPRFLLALIRRIATSTSTASVDVGTVDLLAQEAGLSQSLRSAIKAAWTDPNGVLDTQGLDRGAAGGKEAEDVRVARLMRDVVGLQPGETCALVNGRR